jgi:hypothetical protein
VRRSLKDMEIAFSIRQTSFRRCFVYVFVLHYICVAVGFADQLLVSLDIGGMDYRYHQVIYSGYHHVQTVHYMRLLSNILAPCTVCYLANVRQCLKCLNLAPKRLEHLSRSILFDF